MPPLRDGKLRETRSLPGNGPNQSWQGEPQRPGPTAGTPDTERCDRCLSVGNVGESVGRGCLACARPEWLRLGHLSCRSQTNGAPRSSAWTESGAEKQNKIKKAQRLIAYLLLLFFPAHGAFLRSRAGIGRENQERQSAGARSHDGRPQEVSGVAGRNAAPAPHIARALQHRCCPSQSPDGARVRPHASPSGPRVARPPCPRAGPRWRSARCRACVHSTHPPAPAPSPRALPLGSDCVAGERDSSGCPPTGRIAEERRGECGTSALPASPSAGCGCRMANGPLLGGAGKALARAVSMAAAIGRQWPRRAGHHHQNRVPRIRARPEATSQIPMDQRAAGLVCYLRASGRRCGAGGLRAVPAHAVGMAMRWGLTATPEDATTSVDGQNAAVRDPAGKSVRRAQVWITGAAEPCAVPLPRSS